MEGAGPFYLKGNSVGILIIHGGGGGTCADLKPLMEDIYHTKGYTIHIPLLPGYGTTPKELKNTPISAWISALGKEIDYLKKRCEKIFVGGHSMGGLLTLIIAKEHSFDGIFTINAPVGIKRFGFKLVPFFKLFKRYHNINSEKLKRDTDGAWVGYNKIPLNIATKVKKLIDEMKRALHEVLCPVILLQGCFDSEIEKDSINYIAEKIGSRIKKKIWLKNSDHPILNSPDHKQIVSELINFINVICN
jgi:carboxylesterase